MAYHLELCELQLVILDLVVELPNKVAYLVAGQFDAACSEDFPEFVDVDESIAVAVNLRGQINSLVNAPVVNPFLAKWVWLVM